MACNSTSDTPSRTPWTRPPGVSNSADTNLKNTQNPLHNYGNAAFDARHHLTLTATYDIPG